MNITFRSGEVLTAEKMNSLVKQVEDKFDEEIGNIAETLERLNTGKGV